MALPKSSPGATVKVAARVVSVPVMGLRLPLTAVISASVNPTGNSEKAKVMVAVSPIWVMVSTEVLMLTVGATMSMTILGVPPAVPGLPAASV